MDVAGDSVKSPGSGGEGLGEFDIGDGCAGSAASEGADAVFLEDQFTHEIHE